ncbi:zinc-ribbon domain-containing protein [Pseudarthrobacter sp. CCNWLW207]|uniref:zinc-ribbon domain-containing protein n=1 Tax=Pseudarthrobacter sp. CCNWLW207 TaxID=3127468 RepID=UPI0030785414
MASDLIFQKLKNQKALDALRYMELRAIFRRWAAADTRETTRFEEKEPQLYPMMMAAAAAVLLPAALKKILDPRATYASAYSLLHTTLSKNVVKNIDVLTDGFWLLLRPAFLSVRERIESAHAQESTDPHSIRPPDFPDSVISQVIRPLEPFSRYLNQLKTCDVDRWRDVNLRFYDYGPLPVTHENVPRKSYLSANYICNRGHRHQKAPNTMAAAMKQNRAGCPYCTNALPLAGYNTLAETDPSLATEWHPSLNKTATPSDIIAGGNSRKYWWLCPRGHAYQETPNNLSRSDRRHCPYCSGRLPIPGETTLDVTNPRLASEWATELNHDLTPGMVSEGSGRKVWWLCPNGHSYLADIASRKRTGCPYCANLKVWRGYNDLATTHPRLAAEWHPTLNDDLKPTDIVAGTNRKIWWLCPRQHAYQSAVYSRAAAGKKGCPYCANQRIWPGYNDLATVAPGVASQWKYDANAGLKPIDVGAGTPRKVWWICPEGHSYQAAVNGRVAGSGCPECFRLKRARH